MDEIERAMNINYKVLFWGIRAYKAHTGFKEVIGRFEGGLMMSLAFANL